MLLNQIVGIGLGRVVELVLELSAIGWEGGRSSEFVRDEEERI
jgi:hypothetical protein